MALTSIGGILTIPDNAFTGNAAVNALLDATGEKMMAVFVAPKTGTLGYVRFRTATVTTGDTMKVSFQDRDPATGNPDGTPDQYRTVAVANGDDNVWVLTGLVTDNGADGGAKRSVTKGDRVCVVVEFDSYVAGNLNIQYQDQAISMSNDIYAATYTAGAWTKAVQSMGQFEVLYDDNSLAYSPSMCPGVSTATTLASNTTPDEVAMIFQVPVACVVSGAWVLIDIDGDCDIVLYDSDGTTALATVSLDKDNRQPTGAAVVFVEFAANVTLAASTSYRLAVKPTSTTAVGVRYYAVNAQASLDAFPLGQNCHWSERTDAGSWTQTTTRRLRAGICIAQVHDGASSGGGAYVIGG